MRSLPFEDDSFASVISVQSLEHVPDPERAVAEVARVLAPDGVAVFVTPNRLTLGRPDEIIDPYHYIEFDAEELRTLCGRFFGRVEMRGLFGSRATWSCSTRSGAKLDRLLRLDPARLRRLVPMSAKQRLYDVMLNRYRKLDDPRAEAITPEDFEFRDSGLRDALDVCAVCHPSASR